MKSNKKTCFCVKKFGKIQKKFGKLRKKFGKSLEKVRKFRKLGISELSENYEKMMFNSKFENHKKLVPTWKPTRKFGKKLGMQGLTRFPRIFVSFIANKQALKPTKQMSLSYTVSFTDFDLSISESTLTTFEASSTFWCSWGSSKNWLELKIEPPLANLACLNQWNTL